MTDTDSKAEAAPRKPRKWLRRGFVAAVIVFLGLQLVPVDRQNPPVVADIVAPDDVKHILRRACYDCHSNETRWPWYSYIAPGSWLMAHDVKEGRNYVNFSEWGDYYDETDTAIMFQDECWDDIESGEMPLWFYLPLHPEAKLTDEDIATLKRWWGEEVNEEVAEDDASSSEDEEEDSSEPAQANAG